MNQALRVSPRSLFSLVSCFASWLGISALLMSPAMAQVNGPGPSPSNLFDTVLNLPGDEAVFGGYEFHQGIGGIAGQTTQLNVINGGRLDVGSFDADSGSEVNISGGETFGYFNANSGSEVNISGGDVALFVDDEALGSFSRLMANSGSQVNISGGTVGDSFFADSGSEVTISGGAFGPNFRAVAGSDVELIGGEFRLNGADFSGSTITLAENDVFTGTLADGSSFIFSDSDFDELTDVALAAAALPAADLTPIVVNAPVVSGPSGLRAGQTLTLQAGGSLRNNFAVVDAALNVEGGTLGAFAEAYNSVVNISGGDVGNVFTANSGSVVNITGGEVGEFLTSLYGSEVNISGGDVSRLEAGAGSVVNISGGTVWSRANSGSVVNISGGRLVFITSAFSGSRVNITGGEFDSFIASDGSEVNISGGSFGEEFETRAGSVVNISGTQFSIDGVELGSLVLGESFTITNRDVTLSGLLADGEQFSFQLNSMDAFRNDFFDPDATLTVTLVSPVILGDVNRNEVVSFSDIPAFIAVLQSGDFQAEADCNRDDVVDFADIPAFIQILMGN